MINLKKKITGPEILQCLTLTVTAKTGLNMGVFCGLVAFYLTIEFLIFKSQCTHIELFLLVLRPLSLGKQLMIQANVYYLKK